MGKTERLLVVPNADRIPMGRAVFTCAEERPRQTVVRHVGGFLSADGRQDHDTSHRISRVCQIVSMIAGVWAKGRKDRERSFLPVQSPPSA